ncbi:MAG: hypothetical protein H0V89_10840 [Deltaproteobacteria bacterium]|nr:hypothetical protein [Deltaproteobacteria bacterium]
MTIPRAEIEKLVDAHRKLPDPMTCAIWIRPEASEAWLVEVVSSMEDDDRAGDVIRFNPGITFRFPLALVVGNRESVERAMEKDRELAGAVARGEVLHDGGDAADLVALARRLAA